MNPKKDTTKVEADEAVPEISEAELLKQKKIEAKVKKETEKEEKKAAKIEKKKHLKKR